MALNTTDTESTLRAESHFYPLQPLVLLHVAYRLPGVFGGAGLAHHIQTCSVLQVLRPPGAARPHLLCRLSNLLHRPPLSRVGVCDFSARLAAPLLRPKAAAAVVLRQREAAIGLTRLGKEQTAEYHHQELGRGMESTTIMTAGCW